MPRSAKVYGTAILALAALSFLASRPPASANPPGPNTVALQPSDPEGVSVWHAEGGRLRRCTLLGTDDYVCGPWR
ncbi:MAG: hypothetical protein ACFB6R_05255 [Alphaproteobacteria bacterium]